MFDEVDLKTVVVGFNTAIWAVLFSDSQTTRILEVYRELKVIRLGQFEDILKHTRQDTLL